MKENLSEFQEPIFVNNAGIIILSPFLDRLFEICGLTEQNVFIDVQSQYKAVQLLAYASNGNLDYEEHELVVNKLLCGLPASDYIEKIDLSDAEKEIVNQLLVAVIENWGKLGETSIEGFQGSFLLRNGKLEEEETQYYLQVEPHSYDVLLDFLPWSISNISLAWMKKNMLVKWR